jgi:hypothetical protein
MACWQSNGGRIHEAPARRSERGIVAIRRSLHDSLSSRSFPPRQALSQRAPRLLRRGFPLSSPARRPVPR